MRQITITICMMSIFLLNNYQSTAQQSFKPEDVIHTIGNHQLLYKHVLAYVDIEMEGEDPKLLNDPAYVQELTKECIEEFAEDPIYFVEEMDQHYAAIQMGMGFLQQSNGQTNTAQSQNTQQRTQINNNSNNSSGAGEWNQILSGSVLYYTATESREGLFIQTTQYMHLCPNGTAMFYQKSGGGGGPITALSQLEYTGSSNWQVLTQDNQTYMQMTFQGQTGNFPMGIINQKVQIQGLGTFSVQRGAAQCP